MIAVAEGNAKEMVVHAAGLVNIHRTVGNLTAERSDGHGEIQIVRIDDARVIRIDQAINRKARAVSAAVEEWLGCRWIAQIDPKLKRQVRARRDLQIRPAADVENASRAAANQRGQIEIQ